MQLLQADQVYPRGYAGNFTLCDLTEALIDMKCVNNALQHTKKEDYYYLLLQRAKLLLKSKVLLFFLYLQSSYPFFFLA